MKPEPTISLYPEKSREDLELNYHWMVAAVRLAAAMLVALEGPVADEEQAVHDKVGYLLDQSLDAASKSASVRTDRNGRRGNVTTFINLVLAAVALGSVTARAQKPVDFALYSADATIRTLDITSTHALLASPCRCFHEDDPLAPHTGHLAPLVAFQAGMSYGAIEAGRRLAAHGHPRLGRLILLADIAGEVWAVQHNWRQHEPAPQASGTALSPAPVTVRIP